MQTIVEIKLSKQFKKNVNGYWFLPESAKIRRTAYYYS